MFVDDGKGKIPLAKSQCKLVIPIEAPFSMTNTLPILKAEILKGTRSSTLAQAKQYIDAVLAFQSKEPDAVFHKRFFHEFIPLTTIAEHVGDTETKVCFSGAGHGIDGCLTLNHGQSIRRVELTAATDGHNEALRMELLAECGYAPATGKIPHTGNKNRDDREFGPSEVMEGRSDLKADQVLSLVAKALADKQKKALTRPHYADAWLGISIENYPPGGALKRKHYDHLFSRLLSNRESFRPFSRVFVVSTVGDYLFDSALIAPVD